MRIDVTPLGAASRSVAVVARAVVDYLEGGVGDPGAGLLPTGEWARHLTITVTRRRVRGVGLVPVPRSKG